MKIFNSFTVILFLIFITTLNSISAQEVKVENVRFNIEDGKVAIYYDIMGEEGETYDIEIFLLNDDDPDYRYEPELVTGDIGEVKYFGIDKKIMWDVQKEFPEGLEGESFYFEVTAEETGGIAWYWWVGGAVVGVLVAGAASGGDQAADDGTPAGMAEPPGRPGGTR